MAPRVKHLNDIPTIHIDNETTPEQLIDAVWHMYDALRLASVAEIAQKAIDLAEDLTQAHGTVVDFFTVIDPDEDERVFFDFAYDADGSLVCEIDDDCIRPAPGLDVEDVVELLGDVVMNNEIHVDAAKNFLSTYFPTKG